MVFDRNNFHNEPSRAIVRFYYSIIVAKEMLQSRHLRFLLALRNALKNCLRPI